jgi:hypothetical protein
MHLRMYVVPLKGEIHGALLQLLTTENVGVLEYFTAICHNLWPFGIVCYHLVHFPRFLVCLDLETMATLSWTKLLFSKVLQGSNQCIRIDF